MLLAVDVGNTDTVLGIWKNDTWLYVWRTRSLTDESPAHYEAIIRLHFLENGLVFSDLETAVLSSVVPALTGTLKSTLASIVEHVVVVGPEVFPELKIEIDRPHEIGSDLIANAVAAFVKHGRNCVVVDFGTALTFTTVTADGRILGVAIAPGLKTAVKALFSNTAQLPEVPLQLPESAIGKNTVHAIQSGILLGYESLVRGMITRIRRELDGDCIALATGGLSSIIDTLHGEFVEVNRSLTLDGLRIIGERASKSA
jgi:type III pantothenate kinase